MHQALQDLVRQRLRRAQARPPPGLVPACLGLASWTHPSFLGVFFVCFLGLFVLTYDSTQHNDLYKTYISQVHIDV